MKKPIDIKESYMGDIVVKNGDLKIEYNYSKVFNQIISRVMKTEIGDSSLFPSMGFNWYIYEGMPNNKETAKIIKQAISHSIVKNTPLYEGEFTVDIFPISDTNISIKIDLLIYENPTSYAILYDTSNYKIKSLVI